jgi:hypothetical protein
MKTKFAATRWMDGKDYSLQSKTSYATEANAQRACEQRGIPFWGTQQLPSGRFVYRFPQSFIVEA